MVMRKCCQQAGVSRKNWQDLKIVVAKFSLHERVIRFGQDVLAESDFDRDLPVRSGTDGDFIAAIRNQLSRGL